MHPFPKRTNTGKSLSPRIASRQLGIPVSILSSLRKNGTFKIHFLGNKLGSYHSYDIDNFEKILVNAVHNNVYIMDIDIKETIRFNEIMRLKGYAAESKAAVIKALIGNQITVISATADTTQDALFNKKDVEAIIFENERLICPGAKSKAAAEALGCDTTVLKWLVENKYLEQSTTDKALRITYDSIDRFCDQFIFCSYLGKQINKSARKVVADCQGLGLPIYWAERTYIDSSQPFIELTYLSKLEMVYGAPLFIKNSP